MTYTQVWDAMKNQVSDWIIKRDEDDAFIPFDDANIDYQEYKAWLAEGNEPKPPKQTPKPPIAGIPEPDIREVSAQVQDIDIRLTELENEVMNRR